MSIKTEERQVFSDSGEVAAKGNASNSNRISLASLIDNINFTSLNTFYTNKEDSLFKKRIDKLNLKFYLETEKYLNDIDDMNKCQDRLFLILFKQISLYIQEVERLNLLLREKNEDIKTIKVKLEGGRNKEMSPSQDMINNVKQMNKQLEKRLNEQIINEEKAKLEIESLKRQVLFYKEKLRLDLVMKKFQEINNHQRKEDKESAAGKNVSTQVSHSKKEDSIFVPIIQVIPQEGQNSPIANPPQGNAVTELDLAPIQKKICKRRNFSDSIQTSCQPEIVNSSLTMKRRWDKKDYEMNNININLNVNVENSNKISVQQANQPFAFESKRDTKSSNQLGECLQTPKTTKSNLNETLIKKKGISVGKEASRPGHQNSNSLATTSPNVGKNTKLSFQDSKSTSKTVFTKKVELGKYDDCSNTCLNNRIDLKSKNPWTAYNSPSQLSLQETLLSSIKFYEDEINDLHDLELLLSNAKMELKEQDMNLNSCNIPIEDTNDSFTISCKNYPLSEGEDSSSLNLSKSKTISESKHAQNANKNPSSGPKSTFPMLTSVTIDLSGGNATSVAKENVSVTTTTTTSSSSSKNVPISKSPGNKRQNDWNKTDNTIFSKKKGIK